MAANKPMMPHSDEAERAVLGALLFHPPTWEDVAPIVVATDFYDARHEKIYQAIAACHAEGNGRSADFLIVAERMKHEKTLAVLSASGSEAYLAGLANEAPAAEHAAAHARVVKEKSTLRKLVMVAAEIRDLATADDRPTLEVINIAQTKMAAVMDASIGSGLVKMRTILNDCVRDLAHRYENRGAIVGVPSGLTELDELTTGFGEGLHILAARPSMGKTSLMMQVALNAAADRVPVAVFSLESSQKSLGNRILATEGRVDSVSMKTGMLESRDWNRMTLAMPRIAGHPLWIDDGSAQTVEMIAAKAKQWRRKEAPDAPKVLIVIDYLQYISPSPMGGKFDIRLSVSHISRQLKMLSKELKAPVIALSQLSRGVDQRADKRPMQSDLKESGDIEQDADTIMGIYRDDYYNKKSQEPGIAEVIVMKNRDGATGTVKLAWLPQYTRFENLSRRQD